MTRPLHQTDYLKDKLTSAGATVFSFPLLEIAPPEDLDKMDTALKKLDYFDLLIFVSVNAVKQTLCTLSATQLSIKELSTKKIAAVGKKTAQYLLAQGLDVSVTPDSYFNSESLLALHEIKELGPGDKVAIIRGEGGRNFLKEQLENQGAEVEYINVYRRFCPQTSLDELSEANQRQQLDIIMLTSVQSAFNLFDLQARGVDNGWLSKATLLLGSERIKNKLLSSQYKTGKLLVADDPSDETMFESLLNWVSLNPDKHENA